MTLKRVLLGLLVIVAAIGVAGYAILSQVDVERLRGLIEAEAKSATGRDLQIAGPIDLNISLNPSISVQDVRFANAKWGSKPQMVELKEFDLEVAILPLFSGDIEVKRLIFVEPIILLETNKKGRGNWVFAKSTADAKSDDTADTGAQQDAKESPGDLVLPTIDEFSISGGSIIFRDGQSGEELNLALDKVEAQTDGGSGQLVLSLLGSYNQAPISLNATVGSLSALAAGQASTLKADAEAGGANITLDGTLANTDAGPEFDIAVAVAGDSLAGFSDLAGTDVPPLGPYDIKATLAGAGQVYHVKGLVLTMGGSDLSGNVELTLGGQRPAITAGLVSKLLDVADFTAEDNQAKKKKDETSQAGQSGAGAQSKFVFNKDPLPLDGLKAADAEVKLSAGQVRLDPKMALDSLDVTLSLKNGHLKINPLSTIFASGKIDSGLEVDASQKTPKIAVDVMASGIDYGQLLKDLGVDDTVSGKVNMDIALAGSGKSMRKIASSLSGNTAIVTQNGQINNRIVKILAVGLDEVLGPLLSGQNDARLHCAVSRFEIKKGLAKSTAFLVDSEVLTIIGSGDVNLKKETLDLSFDTATSKASLASLAIPFNVTGTLKSPVVKPDPLGTAASAAKAVENLADGESLIGGLAGLVDQNLGGEQSTASNDGLCQQALSGKKAKNKNKNKNKKKKKDKKNKAGKTQESPAEDLKQKGEDLIKSLGID
ncbi:MAG: AsmA family protein [Pseudomonadota bacterium]